MDTSLTTGSKWRTGGEKCWHAGIFCLFGFSCSHASPSDNHSGKLMLHIFRFGSQWDSCHLEDLIPSRRTGWFRKLLSESVGQYCYIKNLRGSPESMQQQYRQGKTKSCRCCSCRRLAKCHTNSFFRSPTVEWSHQSGGGTSSEIQHVSPKYMRVWHSSWRSRSARPCMQEEWTETHPSCYGQIHKLESNKEGSGTSFQGASGSVTWRRQTSRWCNVDTLGPWLGT